MASQKRQRKRQGQQARRAALEAARQRQERKRRLGLAAALVVGVVLVALLFTYLLGGDDKKAAPTTTSTTAAGPKVTLATVPPVPDGRAITGDTPCPKADGSETRVSKFEKAPPMCIDPKKSYTAVFTTSAGVIKAKLDTTKTPGTANNFVVLARYKYFDGSSFHRTEPSIDIIQGGAPKTQSPGDPGPGYTIKDEPPLDAAGKGTYTYAEGDLVMARTPNPDSASSQYFFSAGPKTKSLEAQGSYVVFGKTTEGLDVLKKVLATHTECPDSSDQSCLGGAPQPPVTVATITIEEA